MEDRLHLRRGAAIFACAASLAAVAPAVASAHASTGCGSKSINIPQKGGKALSVPASGIKVEGGATCAVAYQVIRGAVTKNLPTGWVVREGSSRVPSGLTAEVARKGKMTVRYALVGA